MNLPWALLVEGDVIVLRPGQEIPGHCQGLNQDDPELFFGQIFTPGSQVSKIFKIKCILIQNGLRQSSISLHKVDIKKLKIIED